MSPEHDSKRTRVVVWLACALFSGACAGNDPLEDDLGFVNADDGGATSEVGDSGARGPHAASPIGQDAETSPNDMSEMPIDAEDAGTTPIDGTDASTDTTPDAGPDAGTDDPSGVVCPSKYEVTSPTAEYEGDFPVLEVNGGVPVRGAGCAEQWEGIVMTMGGRGLCTAAFISDRHLISASHCYASDGAVSLRVSAPTWDNGANHTFQAQVKRSGSNQSLDVAIIDLGRSVDWATPARRFVVHAGKASSAELHVYGFGSGGSSGAAGTLRAAPDRATIRVTDNGRGNLSGTAGAAQLCTGDSGGPAFVEKTAPVLYGINQAIVPPRFGAGRTCAGPDWTILFTNVSAYMSFIEQALGKTCERKQVDGMDVAQCW